MIELLSVFGDDLMVANAARVSMSKWHKEFDPEADIRLIKYLARNKHISPFFHPHIQFRIEAPIFVARQWFRHVVGTCVTGDTEVSILSFAKGRNKGLRKITMERLWRRWTYGVEKPKKYDASEAAAAEKAAKLVDSGLSLRAAMRVTGLRYNQYRRYISPYDQKESAKDRSNIHRMRLRSLNVETGIFGVSHITNVMQQGVKPVYKVTLADGKTIKMTDDHKILTEDGWKTLKDAVGLECTKSGLCYMTRPCAIGVNGLPIAGTGYYRNPEWLQEQKELGASVLDMAKLCRCSYHTIRKWLKRHGLQFDQMQFLSGFGDTPWNKGVTGYKLNSRPWSEERLNAVRRARSGANSNFWRGGKLTGRKSMRAKATAMAAKLHKTYGYACQKCGATNELHAHHIIPVAIAPELALAERNLITLCGPCHRLVHASAESEIKFANEYCGLPPIPPQEWKEKRKPQIDGHMRVKYVSVVSVEYIGEEMTYDLSVEGCGNNFVGNGIVVHNCRSETSRRYVDAPPEFFVPDEWRSRPEQSIKQGSGVPVDEFTGSMAYRYYDLALDAAQEAYRYLLEAGIAPEQARMVLPQSMMTQWIETGSLYFWANFCRQRLDSHAQAEIREYAEQIGASIAPRFPASWAALMGDPYA